MPDENAPASPISPRGAYSGSLGRAGSRRPTILGPIEDKMAELTVKEVRIINFSCYIFFIDNETNRTKGAKMETPLLVPGDFINNILPLQNFAERDSHSLHQHRLRL
jgi:hypothetical protein